MKRIKKIVSLDSLPTLPSRAWLASVCLTALLGCITLAFCQEGKQSAVTNQDGEYTLNGTKGTVTMDGKPVAGATVTFTPVDPEKSAPEPFVTPEGFQGVGIVLFPEDGYIVVKNVIKDGPADKSGEIHSGDRIRGIGQGKDGRIEEVVGFQMGAVITRIKGPEGTIVRLEVLPGGKEPSKIVELVRDEVNLFTPPADGGFVSANGNLTHLIVCGPAGSFNPQTYQSYHELCDTPIRATGANKMFSKMQMVDGKNLMLTLTDDPEKVRKAIESIPQVEYLRTERLTKEMFEEHIKSWVQSGRVPPDGGNRIPVGGFTHLIIFGAEGGFAPVNPMDYMNLVNPKTGKFGVRAGQFRSRLEDGKLIAYALTSTPEAYEKLIDSLPQLKHLRTAQLTREMFDVFENTPSESLPPADSGKAPVIIKMEPANGAMDVDAATVKELRVTFDVDMSGGMSWCNPSGAFPESTGQPPKWIDKRTCVLPVALQSGKNYVLSINLPGYTNFKSAAGVPVVPVEYKFSTTGYDATKQDGGYTTPMGGYTHLVTFQGTGDFKPSNPGQLLGALNAKLFPAGIATGYFRTKPVDGKLVGSICTHDSDGLERVIKSIPELEFVRTERLTKEMFEAYEKTAQLSLPSPPSPRMLEIEKSDWFGKLNEMQKKYVRWDEAQFAHVYDPKNYDVGNDRDASEKRWLAELEKPEPVLRQYNTLSEYDAAIFGLATIKSDKALKPLVKIAAERVFKDNAYRHTATKALGVLGDPAAVPELIPLLYHFNFNTRLDAQISLVRLTGQNFGRDAKAWGEWYEANREKLGKDMPKFDATPVDWTCGSDYAEIKQWSDPQFQEERDKQWAER